MTRLAQDQANLEAAYLTTSRLSQLSLAADDCVGVEERSGRVPVDAALGIEPVVFEPAGRGRDRHLRAYRTLPSQNRALGHVQCRQSVWGGTSVSNSVREQ